MRIWLVPALAAAMVIAAVVASRASPAPALAPALAPAPPRHYALPPPPPVSALPPSCDELVTELHRYERCPILGPDARAAVHESITTMLTSLRSAAETSREATEGACRQADDALVQAMTTIGC